MKLECKVISDGKHVKHGKRAKRSHIVKSGKGQGTGSKLAKAAHLCKGITGRHGDSFRKCVKAKIKKLK